jgi:Na+-driven multidrug efflux pump
MLAAGSPIHLAAFGVGHRVTTLAYTACAGLAAGTTSVVGQWAGARQHAKATASAHAAAKLAALTMLPVGAAVWLGAPHAAALFAGGDALLSASVASYLHTVAIAFPFSALTHHAPRELVIVASPRWRRVCTDRVGCMHRDAHAPHSPSCAPISASYVACTVAVDAVYEGALVGLQCTGRVLAVNGAINCMRIPLALVLSQAMGLGVKGVWVAIALSMALKAPAKWLAFRFAKSDGARTAQ